MIPNRAICLGFLAAVFGSGLLYALAFPYHLRPLARKMAMIALPTEDGATEDELPAGASTKERIHVIHIQDKNDSIPLLAACSVRSAALLNPDSLVTVHMHPRVNVSLWADLPNVRTKEINFEEYFGELTLLSEW